MIKIKNISRHPLKIPEVITTLLNKYPTAMLAGGAIRDGLKGREINDYDLFFTSRTEVEGVKTYLEDMGYSKVFACPLGHLYTYKNVDVKVQLILKTTYYGIDHLFMTFDFDMCCFAYKDGVVYTTRKALKSNRKKNLTLNNLMFPSATINRLYKYRKAGWYVGGAIREITQFLVDMDASEYDPDSDELYVD